MLKITKGSQINLRELNTLEEPKFLRNLRIKTWVGGEELSKGMGECQIHYPQMTQKVIKK